MTEPVLLRLSELPMRQVVAHSGHGEVLTSRVLGRGDVKAACNFFDYTVIPPGASVALHRHASDNEEYYLVLSGRGEMTVDGDTFEVKPFDLVRNRPGGQHGLVNISSCDELRIFVFELPVV